MGVKGLTENMENLLSLGLKFVPVDKVNKAKVESDIERLKTRLMWDTYWKWKADTTMGGEGEQEEEESRKQWEARRRKERRFEGRTDRVPDGLPQRMKEAIIKYCETVKEDIFRGLRREVKDNLTPEARIAMKEIQEKVRMKEWGVRPADKGGGICVESYENIVKDGQEELKDETTFKKINKTGVGSTVRKVEEKLKEMRDRGVITTKMREFMTAKNTKAGTMKVNRKVHKKVKKNGRHPTRVYVSGIGTPTEGIAGLVEEELKEGVEKQDSYIQDTADFLRKLREVGRLANNEWLFTMDIVALYPMVPRKKAEEAMRKNLDSRNTKAIPTEDLMELASLVLDNNEFEFEGESHIQKEGTAIGSKLGKNYACAYMGEWEKEVNREAEERIGKKPRFWKRFVDDIIGLWRGSKEEFLKFIEICNNNEERIKVTYEICEKEAIFLDVKVTRKDDGELKTELYVKPTDRTRYLHRDSDHPRHVKEGIAKGQARRLRRLCSEDEDYWKYAEKTKEKLMSRGYGETQIKRQLKEGFKMSREEALERAKKKEDKKINFVTTHSAYLPNVNKILKRHGHYLKEEGLDRYIKEIPRLSLRRGKNLSDLVVNAKNKVKEGGSGPCGRGCKLCNFMVETKEIRDKRGEIRKIKGKMDCRTVGAIYGMWCKRCEKVVYVGKTQNRVMDRFIGHRADLRGDDDTKPAYHFKQEGHKDEDMGVMVIEEVKGKDDVYRVTRERYWINSLGTYNEENKRK